MREGEKITVKGSQTHRFYVTLDSLDRVCQRCGAPIHWAVTARGKKMPIDTQADDGMHLSHFATCQPSMPRV